MSLPLVSLLVPMRNEEGFIESCLASLLAQYYPADRLELLILDGQSDDRSPALVRALAETDPRIRLIDNPGRSQASAMNLGIRQARGEIIVRADAHATYGPSYVETCVQHLLAGRAENVGGLQRGQGTGYFGRAVAAALNTSLGAGNAPYRLATEQRYADTVWLGAWKKSTLEELGGFDETLPANEDYELNCRLRAAGGRILLDPALPSVYYPRTSPLRLWRQYFRYGVGKVRVLRRHPDTLVLRQLIPPVAILALGMAAFALIWSLWPFAAVGGLYLLAVLLGSVQAARRGGLALSPVLPLVFPIIHFAWAAGFWWETLHGGVPLRPRSILRAERLVRDGKVEK